MQSLDKYASTSSRKYIPSIWYQRQKAGLNGFRWKRLSSIWDRITPTTCLCSERSQLSLMKPTWGLWISKNLKYFSIIFRDVKILGNCKYLFHSKYFLFASCFYWTKALSARGQFEIGDAFKQSYLILEECKWVWWAQLV